VATAQRGGTAQYVLLQHPHLTHELRDAVKRVRRKASLINSFFQEAKL
jgi:hypothetical protein